MDPLVGRWRLLPSGLVFTVKRVVQDLGDARPMALCRADGARCYAIPARDLRRARARGLLQYLGKGNAR